MSTHSNAAPVIIKRKKVVSGDGHHGGAWKVAIAFPLVLVAFRVRLIIPPPLDGSRVIQTIQPRMLLLCHPTWMRDHLGRSMTKRVLSPKFEYSEFS
jgi:hypothetical protein